MIDDKTFDAMLHSIRNDEVDVSPVDVQVEGRRQTVDFGAFLTRLVAERDDAIAQLQDADEGTDAATQTAERVVRELRQEYADVIDRLEKQSAAREEALRKEHNERTAFLRAEVDRLHRALAFARDTVHDVAHLGDADYLYDHLDKVLKGGKP